MSTAEHTDQKTVPSTPAVESAATPTVEAGRPAVGEPPGEKPVADRHTAGSAAKKPETDGAAEKPAAAAPAARPAAPAATESSAAAPSATPAPAAPAGDPAAASTPAAPTEPAAVPTDAAAASPAPAAADAPAADGDRSPQAPQGGQQQGGDRPQQPQQRQGKKGRRGRDKQRQGGDQQRDDRPTIPCTGILDVLPDGFGFLRTSGFSQGDRDVYVSLSQIRRFGLRRGDMVAGQVREPKENEKYSALLKIDTVNGVDPDTARKRPVFEQLTPLFPEERLRLETDEHDTAARIMDLLCPIGKGQRGLITSPPKAGKTTILKKIALSLKRNHPDVHSMMLLVDERPEEVTDLKESVGGDIFYSTFDEPPESHARVSELTLERAMRFVEQGRDVVILLDSLTRMSRAYNTLMPGSARVMTGGTGQPSSARRWWTREAAWTTSSTKNLRVRGTWKCIFRANFPSSAFFLPSTSPVRELGGRNCCWTKRNSRGCGPCGVGSPPWTRPRLSTSSSTRCVPPLPIGSFLPPSRGRNLEVPRGRSVGAPSAVPR